MPTAAQRQRAAALAQLNHQQQRASGAQASKGIQQQAHASSSKQQSTESSVATAATKTKRKPLDTEWEDGAFSDEDSDEEAVAFEMDGQDNWTQNFCATCDTLIEPGQGLIAKKEETSSNTALHSPTSSISRASGSGLKSKSGTIKARPTSSDEAGNSATFKRTNSAGRIHAVGHGPFGPGKRTGSAGSRLNALSELRPTTKLHDAPKGKQADNSGSGHRSPASSRRSSTVSVRSAQSGGNGAESRPSSPISPSSGLPPTKRQGGLLGSLTPAALKQQEELEMAKSKAPAALYCSERCRQIDEQRSEGMGELVYYLQQPAISPPTAGWHSGPSSYGAWSSRNSNSNIATLMMTPAAMAAGNAGGYGNVTPDSECACPECLDKNSASGTVPSGASDTTESSTSYQYGPRGTKQRTTSGRIVTPQNLVPPGMHSGTSDYFGNAALLPSTSARLHASLREGISRARLHRDSFSQAGTVSSAKSSDSGSDLWEPRTRSSERKSQSRQGESSTDGASVTTSEFGRGSTTTGTVTPDGVYSSVAERTSPTRGVPSGNVPRERGLSVSALSKSSQDLMSTSQASTTSPLRLLRHGDHRALASVDVSADIATSPHPYSSSLLSRSLASERTEGAASSGFTAVGSQQAGASFAAASFLDRRQSGRPLSRLGSEVRTSSDVASAFGNVERFTDSPAPFGEQGSKAFGTLSRVAGQSKQSSGFAHASQKGTMHRLSSSSSSANGMKTDRNDDTSESSTAPGGDGSGTSSTGSGWLRNSLSAAWNSIRGANAAQGASFGSLSSNFSSSSSVAGVAEQSHENNPGHLLGPEEPTPTQSLIKRPTIKRGDVPAFASEIGQGAIPGERGERERQAEEWDDLPPSAGASKSFAAMQGNLDLTERRLQRKAERERAHRHQRSKDVTVLPPLLGVARPASSVNLHGAGMGHGGSRSQRTHSITSSRSDNSESPLLLPVRSTTPGMIRSAHGGSYVGLHEYGTSPGRLAGAIGSYGTSPRRAGLGWGALTPIGPAPQEHQRVPNHVTSTVNASRPHLASHTSQHHHHHHHHHSSTLRHGKESKHGSSHHHHHHHHSHHQSLQHIPSRSHISTLPPHGTIGVLGAHPLGSGPVAGRHATTPVRMSTPRVPENGGEMTGAQLKGEEDFDDDDLAAQRSALPHSYNRRSLLSVPPRPSSVNYMRGHHAPPNAVFVDQYGQPLRPPSRSQTPSNASLHGRKQSSEEPASVKMYPVLDVPNRQPTHDRYDMGWGLGNEGLSHLLAQQQQDQQLPLPPKEGVKATLDDKMSVTMDEQQDRAAYSSRREARASSASIQNDSPSQQRKKLFYFDTS